jgi:hypothetical protein
MRKTLANATFIDVSTLSLSSVYSGHCYALVRDFAFPFSTHTETRASARNVGN